MEIADDVEERPIVEQVRGGFEGVQSGEGVRHEADDAPRATLSLITTRGASLGPVPGDMLPSLDERCGAAVERQPLGREAVSLGGSGRTGLPPPLDADAVASRMAWIPDACGRGLGLAGMVHSASAKFRRISGSLSQSGKKRRAACRENNDGKTHSGSGGSCYNDWMGADEKRGVLRGRDFGRPCRMPQQPRARLQTAKKGSQRGGKQSVYQPVATVSNEQQGAGKNGMGCVSIDPHEAAL